MPDYFENPWTKYLEDMPRAPFYALAQRESPQYSTSVGGRRRAENVFSDALNQYYGSVGEEILSGKAPTMTFTSFLQNYKDIVPYSEDPLNPDINRMFPYSERFTEQRRQFGDTTRYAPRTRSLFF